MARRQLLLSLILLGTSLLGGQLHVQAQPAPSADPGCRSGGTWTGCAGADAGHIPGGIVLRGETESRGATGTAGGGDAPSAQPRKPPPPREAVPGAEDTPGQDNFVPPVREQCTDAPDVCNPSLVISLSDIA